MTRPRPRHSRKAALTMGIAMAFVIGGTSPGSARADDHGHDGWYEGHGHHGERHGHGRRGHDTYVTDYDRGPDVYYAPPLVVYPPPRPSPGISVFFPIWLRW
jgi:hypothetical protein